MELFSSQRGSIPNVFKPFLQVIFIFSRKCPSREGVHYFSEFIPYCFSHAAGFCSSPLPLKSDAKTVLVAWIVKQLLSWPAVEKYLWKIWSSSKILQHLKHREKQHLEKDVGSLVKPESKAMTFNIQKPKLFICLPFNRFMTKYM